MFLTSSRNILWLDITCES